MKFDFRIHLFFFCCCSIAALLTGPSAMAAPLSAEATCLLKTSLAGSKVAKTQNAQSARCLLERTKYDPAESKGLSAEATNSCVLGTAESRVPKARDRVGKIGSTKCGVAPSFGYSGADNIARAAAEQSLGLMQDLLGSDIGNTIATRADDASLAACQTVATKGALRVFGKQIQQFTNCLKDGLKNGSITDTPSLEACLDEVSDDPEGKIARLVSSLGKTISRKCGTIPLGTALPGRCANAGTPATCIAETTACRACLQLSDAHNLSDRDCDLFDDGTNNDSCIACNGAASLCDRRFDEVVYPTSHNAMSNEDDGWIAPNNYDSTPKQLEAGIRSLMLDAWYWGGEPVLCHGGEIVPGLGCDFTGQRPLEEGLAELATWLDNNPHEVLSIIWETYISEADMLANFTTSGLLDHAYIHDGSSPWPTLRELIQMDKRLIVFTDDSSAVEPWHHYVWSHAVETHFSFTEASQFESVASCAPNRGSTANSLFILNHFLTNPFASPALANTVNFNPMLRSRALACQQAVAKLPNFLTVDFQSLGDLYKVVRELNQLPPLQAQDT